MHFVVSSFLLLLSDPKTRQVIQRKYRSQMSDQICYSVLCLFSYIAAGLENKKKSGKSGHIIHGSPEIDPSGTSIRLPKKLSIPSKR